MTVIDIDTLIFLTSHLINNDKNFKELLNAHLSKMTHRKNVHGTTEQQIIDRSNINITEQLSPIADRNHDIDFEVEQLVNQFREIITDKN
ncbi:MAG: hypothetical protein ABIN25_04000 [Ginsengibacter sp.]